MILIPFFHNSSFGNILLVWIIIIGLIAFALMGYDKLASKISVKRRVREKNFWLISALGGFVGVGVGAIVFHHKVSKMRFWPPVIASTVVWLALFYFVSIL